MRRASGIRGLLGFPAVRAGTHATDFVHVFSKSPAVPRGGRCRCRSALDGSYAQCVVVGLAFLATVIASLFAQSMLVRFTQGHKPQNRAWAIALAMFALASAALSTGLSTGWDQGTFRVFFLFGAVLNVPWMAMGTVYLFAAPNTARRVCWGLVLFSGFAAGVLLSAPMAAVHGTAIPVGKDVFGALPRILAAVGSGVAAVVIIGGAVLSATRFARDRSVPGNGRLAAANTLIAVGTLVLSSGGLVQGVVGHDESFTLSLAVGISIIYGGFVLASSRPRVPAATDPGPVGGGRLLSNAE